MAGLDRATLGRTDMPTAPLRGEGVVKVSGQGIYDESATQKYPIGKRMGLGDGRVFYYSKNATVALVAGKLCGISAAAANGYTRAEVGNCVATSAGLTKVQITAVATMAVNVFSDGYMVIHAKGTSAKGGHIYKIRGNDAITAASTGNVYIYDPLVVALDTGHDYSIFKSPYSDVVISIDYAHHILGVPLIPVTASYYFWMQTYGPAAVLAGATTGALAKESELMPHATTDGAYNTGVTGQQKIGWHVYYTTDGVATEYDYIFLTCMA